MGDNEEYKDALKYCCVLSESYFYSESRKVSIHGDDLHVEVVSKRKVLNVWSSPTAVTLTAKIGECTDPEDLLSNLKFSAGTAPPFPKLVQAKGSDEISFANNGQNCMLKRTACELPDFMRVHAH